MKGGEAHALPCAAGSLVPSRRVPYSAEVAVTAAVSTCVSLSYPMVRLLCVSADPAGRARRRGGRGANNREEKQRKIYRYAECCVCAEDVGCGEHPLVISLGPRRMRVG